MRKNQKPLSVLRDGVRVIRPCPGPGPAVRNVM